MEEPEIQEREIRMPPLYSKGMIYTRELTPEGIAELSDEDAAEVIELCDRSSIELRPLEERYSRYYQLDEGQRKELLSYCMELDFWHEDLDFIPYEMDTSVRYFHQDRLDQKRLAINYHTDNFYFRIHAYREKIFKLVNIFVGLGIPDRPHEVNFNDRVLDELGRQDLSEIKRLLSDLFSDPLLSEAIRRRNAFAHRLAKRDCGILKPDERIYDHIYVRKDSDKRDKIMDLDLYHMIKENEFSRICERLAKFRDELVAALKASCP